MAKHVAVREDPRIYAIFAQTVQTVDLEGVVHNTEQPCGRVLAQAVHVGRLLGFTQCEQSGGIANRYMDTTTITLAARDTKEMEHIQAVLDLAKIPYRSFKDTNGPVYGYENPHAEIPIELEAFTAIITHPIEPHKVKGLLDYLPLWRHSLDVPR